MRRCSYCYNNICILVLICTLFPLARVCRRFVQFARSSGCLAGQKRIQIGAGSNTLGSTHTGQRIESVVVHSKSDQFVAFVDSTEMRIVSVSRLDLNVAFAAFHSLPIVIRFGSISTGIWFFV